MMTNHCYDVIITHQKLTSFMIFLVISIITVKQKLFRDVIYLMINQCEPRIPKGVSGGHKVSASRAAQASESRLSYRKHNASLRSTLPRLDRVNITEEAPVFPSSGGFVLYSLKFDFVKFKTACLMPTRLVFHHCGLWVIFQIRRAP